MPKITVVIVTLGYLIFNSQSLFSQTSSDRNFVQTTVVKAAGQKTITAVDALANNGKNQTISYVDGLGRPIQQIAIQSSPLAKDIISPVEYDGFGREQKKFLPYVDNGTAVGTLRSSMYADQSMFYSPTNSSAVNIAKDSRPFSQAYFEPSPLSRVLEQGAPGETWQPGAGHTTSVISSLNTSSEAIIHWIMDNVNPLPINAGIYADGDLFKLVATDEQGNKSIEYKNKDGETVLKKQQIASTPGIDHTGWLCTYYIYDDFDQLRFVFQPKAVEQILTGVSIASLQDELCFKYDYDERHRMITKKVPGAGLVNMVYDRRDRLVFVQDANMRTNNQWLTTLYDGLNRVTSTGMITYTGDRASLQSYVNGNTGNGTSGSVTNTSNLIQNLSISTREIGRGEYKASQEINFTPEFESEPGAEFVAFIDPSQQNETINFVDNPLPPGNNFIALTISYYDDYSHAPGSYTTQNNSQLDAGNNLYAETLPAQNANNTRGLATGSKVRVIEDPANLGAGAMLASTVYYDDKGRSIQSQSYNYKGGLDISTNLYDFTGKVLATHLAHNNPAVATTLASIKTNMEYDHAGRVMKIYKTIGGDPLGKRLIVSNSYNELGQLKTKSLDPDAKNGAGLETLSYDYNIRGWMLGMNRDYARDANNSHYFGFDLGYDKAANDLVGGQSYTNPQFNGNISGTVWKAKGDGEKRKYDFSYDAANRLTAADFNQYTSSSFNKSAGINFSVGNLSYDANGNINSMQQWGLKGTSSQLIDNLVYQYLPNSNKLKAVTDDQITASAKLGDFQDKTDAASGEDYRYDANGNMVKDFNKDIWTLSGTDKAGGIVYNHLNLPSKITVDSKGTINYVYDATGNKLAKKVVSNGTTADPRMVYTNTYYIGGIVYEAKAFGSAAGLSGAEQFQFAPQEEGRMRYKAAAGNNPAAWVFDYMLKDHLGNVRAMITDEEQTDQYPPASMETANATLEKTYYSKIDETRVPISGIAGYPTNDTYTNPNQQVAKVNGSGNKIGPGITLKVMAGDKFNLRVSSWYKTAGVQPGTPVSPVNDIVAALVPGISGYNKITATDLQNGGTLPPGVTDYFNNEPSDGTRPKAYVNWILFDEQFKYVAASSGAEQVPAETAFGTAPNQSVYAHVKTDLPITKNGYLYVYVSNETPNIDVFFDNLQVTHVRGALLEESQFYPFGLTMAGISTKAIAFSDSENKFKFQDQEIQSKEFSDGSGLEMYEFKYRFDDPQIGRFWSIDPLADKYVYNSTYAFSENKVTNHVELEGLEAEWSGFVINKGRDEIKRVYGSEAAAEYDKGVRCGAVCTGLVIGSFYAPNVTQLFIVSYLSGFPINGAPQLMAGEVMAGGSVAATDAGVAATEAESLATTNGGYLNGVTASYEVSAAHSVSGEPFVGGLAELKDGKLITAISLKNAAGEYLTKAGTTTGADVFNSLFNEVKTAGGQIDGIQGNWYSGDNLQAFNQALLNGESPTKAALGTFTGGQAAARGYTNVTIVGGKLNADGITYSSATVDFTKPIQ